jgi:glycosyltransferase involved in cell wall biosynthesis
MLACRLLDTRAAPRDPAGVDTQSWHVDLSVSSRLSNVPPVFLFVVNNPEFFVSHRLVLGEALLAAGFDVHLAGPDDPPAQLVDSGIRFHRLRLTRQGRNPFSEIRTILDLARLYRRLRPVIVHLITIKPYLYGGVAARLAKGPAVVYAVSGLGTTFIRNDFKGRLFRGLLYPLYRAAFRGYRERVIFQNDDDRSALVSWGIVRPELTALIKGSGVDLNDFPVQDEPEGAQPVVAFAARLLADKGVRTYVEAARLLRHRGVEARLLVIGSPDPGNVTSIDDREIEKWRAEGAVELLGQRSDVPALYSNANIVCLPSRREGLPKSLVEAAAAGRAVVTTDVPGCRDAIEPGITGLLVPVDDPEALADALQFLIENPAVRKKMGQAGRKLAEREYSVEIIAAAHMEIYRQLLS